MTDQDADGYAATTTEYAQASDPANGRRRYLLTNITAADCLDTDATKYQNLTGYPDLDADTYTTAGTNICSGASLPAYNQTTFPYRSAASATADCYDVNSTGGVNAKPGQTAFFTVNRGDGSYDYNCDGTANGIANLATLTFNTSCVAIANTGAVKYMKQSNPIQYTPCPTGFGRQSNYAQIGTTSYACAGALYYSGPGSTVSTYTCLNATGSTQYQ